MRILVLSTCYPSDELDPSGVFIAQLLKALQKRGHFVKVIAPSNGISYGYRVVDGIETVRFPYFLPRSLEKLTRGAGGIPENIAESRLARIQVIPMMSTFLFATLAQIGEFDLIYANWLGAGAIGVLAKVFSGRPLVVSFRGDDGYLARDRTAWRLMAKWVILYSDALAPVSGELHEILLGLGTPKEKCFLPRFGVDVNLFRPRDERRTIGGEVRVLYVGAMLTKKGVHDLIEAVADPEIGNVRLVLLGDGYATPHLLEMAEKMGIRARVDWKGLQPHHVVAEEMRSADILCLPSYTEGRPNVVNEAMASGLPVIATRIGGIPDMVQEGRSALLYKPGEVETLKGHLKMLVRDPVLRKSMGVNGRDFLISSGLNWDVTAKDFEDIFSYVSSRG